MAWCLSSYPTNTICRSHPVRNQCRPCVFIYPGYR